MKKKKLTKTDKHHKRIQQLEEQLEKVAAVIDKIGKDCSLPRWAFRLIDVYSKDIEDTLNDLTYNTF